MYFGIALLTDVKNQNLGKRISFEGLKKYGIENDSAFLPQHISLKQSFPFDGDVCLLEDYFENLFFGARPVELNIKSLELFEISEHEGIMWFEIHETEFLRSLHTQITQELRQKLGIEPLGFDGDRWKFHSTIINTKHDVVKLKELYVDYKKHRLQSSVKVNHIVIFCCMGNPTNARDYFTYKLIELGR